MKLYLDHSPPDLDLGSDRVAWWTQWSPDRDLNPQYIDLPDIPRLGLILQHGDQPTAEGGAWCIGSIMFDSEVTRRVWPDHPRWTVESWDPLTLSPSILVRGCCHGFIRGGLWVTG